MPKKITDFKSKTSLDTLDLIPIIDVTDDTMDRKGSNKKIDAGVFANGLAKLFTSNAIISANTTVSALRITQIGTGDALLIEDGTNPDSSPFVIDNNGRAISGATIAKSIDNPYTNGQLFPKIQVVGNEADGASIGIFQAQTNAASGVIFFAKARGTSGTETIVNNGDQLGRISFQSFGGITNKESAVIATVVDSNVINDTSAPAAILFQTKPGTNNPDESMRITSSGYVGIGTSAPLTTLHVVGNATLPRTTFSDTVTLPTGNATSAALKFVAGANLTTAQAGVVEFDGTNLHITNSATTRKTLAFTDAVSTYVHPSGDGNKHVPQNGTTNVGKVLTATATAGVYEWTQLTLTDTIQTRTASWTLGLSDVGSYIRLKSSGAGLNPITITIPTHAAVAIPIGSDIKFYKVDGMVLSFGFGSADVTVTNNQIGLISVGEMFAIKKVENNMWDFI